ncbi:hypothetical protein M569_12624, partial [Genlisea aurea]
FDYSKRAQWLRAAILGANDGLLSTASLMVGIGAVKKDTKSMVLAGIAGLLAGACSMAIGEFVSVYAQYDIEVAQIEREKNPREVAARVSGGGSQAEAEEEEKLPNPYYAAISSGFSFVVGAAVPLLAAGFIKNYQLRLGVVVAAVTSALVSFGYVGAVLGKANPLKSTARVLIGGWVAMGLTFGLTKAVGSTGL